jgi:hypothetical protein
MSTDLGAAPAAADSAPAPAPQAEPEVVSLPNPIDVAPQPAPEPKPEEKKAPSTREALDKAFKTVEAKQAEAKKPEAKPPAEVKAEAKAPKVEAKPEPAKADEGRDPVTGKFTPKAVSEKPADAAKPVDAAKPSHTAEDAPARFTETAKAKWASADPEIRGEVRRMERELTEGYQKHKAAADRDGSLAEFHDMATKSGTTVKDAMARYVGIENKLRQDLLGGLDEVVSNATQGKYSLRDIAAHVMGQKPEEVQSQSDATIRELKQTVQRLEQQIGGVTQTITKQREQSTLTEINAFAEKHPRFEALSNDIAFFMTTGRAKDLPEAYELAERLNPAPAKATEIPPKVAETAADTPDLAEQIRKGSKSPSGDPSPGSEPAVRKPSKSNREAVDRSFASLSMR